MKRVVMAIVLLVMATGSVLGAAERDSIGWGKVQQLYYDQEYKKAYKEAESLFKKALKEGQSRDLLVGAVFMSKTGAAFMEDCEDSSLARYRAILPRLQGADKCICHLYLAMFYANYYAENSWRVSRNAATDEEVLDYSLWDERRFEDTVYVHLKAALSEEALLTRTQSRELAWLADTSEVGDYDVYLTPTLYDMMVVMAQQVVIRFPLVRLGENDLMPKEAVVGTPEEFVEMEVKGIEGQRLALLMMKSLQEMERFHLRDGSNDSVLICVAGRRVERLRALLVKPPASDDTVFAKKMLERFRGSGSSCIADYYYTLASDCSKRRDYVKALRYVDTAVALYPGSRGAVQCENLRAGLLYPYVQCKMRSEESSDAWSLMAVETRNVERLWLRVVKHVDLDGDYDKRADRLRSLSAVKEWSVDVERRDDYGVQHCFVAVPELEQGYYYVLASPTADFKKYGFVYDVLCVSDVAVLPAKDGNRYQRGFVVKRQSGRPVSGQKVCYMVEEERGDRVMAEAKTDGDGYYDMTPAIRRLSADERRRLNSAGYVQVVYDGMATTYGRRSNVDAEEPRMESFSFYERQLFDRPVYKPGDTVHTQMVVSRVSNMGHVEGFGSVKVFFWLSDVNGEIVAKDSAFTDDFGQCGTAFAVPADGMPGRWKVLYRFVDAKGDAHTGNSYVKVEAYKQPKFVVTLGRGAGVRNFGEEAAVEGRVVSYSGVPVNDAKVSYTVTRREIHQTWRSRWWRPSSMPAVVDIGELRAGNDGSFRVAFVPLPDSNCDLSQRPCFRYEVLTVVTDLNGETHEASTSLSVGYVNSYMSLNEYGADGEEPLRVACSMRNLDGSLVDGTLRVEVELLEQSCKPLLSHPLGGGADILMPQGEALFRKEFPLFDLRDEQKDYDEWRVEKRLPVRTVKTEGKPEVIDFGKMKAGVYRVRVSGVDPRGDTLSNSRIVVNEAEGMKEPFDNSLLWSDVRKHSVEVGDTVHLRIGSRFPDVTVYVTINKNTQRSLIHDCRTYKVSGNIKEIDIPVTLNMLGDFVISLAAVKEGCVARMDYYISVPDPSQQLDVEFSTFRNKMEPGDRETWTLTVKNRHTTLPERANLALTMYDHALDTYGSMYWYLSPWKNGYTGSSLFVPVSVYTSSHHFFGRAEMLIVPYFRPIERTLYDAFYHPIVVERNSKIMAPLRKGNGKTDASMRGFVEDDADLVAELKIEGQVAEEEMEEEQVTLFSIVENNEEGNDDEVELRQNLSTLAFFRPNLRSDEEGNVSVSFTAPDLLTEWSILGLAWTKEMKTGSLQASAITQKRLMVTPNVPRFLYQGDSCRFSVKVSNLSGVEQNVAVSLEMTDGVTGKPLAMVADGSRKQVVVPMGGSREVSFLLAVPEGEVFVANYKLIARGEGCSDGETAPIPLLTRRQLVTESMAFYINGVGEKHYEMKHLTGLDTTAQDFTLQQHALTVDLTPNPIWLALQSIPYVEQQRNPSNIFLANSIYTNSLAALIVDQNPLIRTLFDEWMREEPDAFLSNLERNADLSQTVAENTPWLREARSETQRHREIANFFDAKKIDKRLSEDLSRLIAAQRPDGGWSWIPGGKYSSVYTTQYILKTFGLLQQQGVKLDGKTQRALRRAMDYVDAEIYDYYRKYIKGTDFEPVNLDYLYVRSWYPDNRLTSRQKEAYNFFYNNAKKYNRHYTSLYSQSLLSLVFHRHGDKRLAREMANRIREKSLYSDEMGMYWRDNTSGYFWDERPVETQALLIRTFAEVLADWQSVPQMQQWLLKQKQTTAWNSDVASVNAVQALLLQQPAGPTDFQPYDLNPAQMAVAYGNHRLETDTTRHQLHLTERLEANEIVPSDGKLTLYKADPGIAWGALYWQYFEEQSKIPASSMGVTITRTLYRIGNDNRLTLIDRSSTGEGQRRSVTRLRVGDKVRVRLEITTDRNLEYLELKEPRTAAMEPISTSSGWRWNNGLSYYCSVTNTCQTLYIDRLDKGRYVVEYDLYVNNAGTYTTAPTTMQCLYAPEFRALCPVPTLVVE